MSLVVADLADRIAAALAAPPPSGLLSGDLIDDSSAPLRHAAVLVAITERAEPGVLLTLRHDNLRDHGGQVAFPGGRLDPGEDARTAALREAQEELALDSAGVRIIGEGDPYRTITNFAVTPVIARVAPDLPLTPNPAEVADWFEAPLAFLLDPANQRRREAFYRGRTRHYYEILWGERRIWGATAAMLVNLTKRLS